MLSKRSKGGGAKSTTELVASFLNINADVHILSDRRIVCVGQRFVFIAYRGIGMINIRHYASSLGVFRDQLDVFP